MASYSQKSSAYSQKSPAYIWDYDIEELKKTKSGRLLILERKINYGPDGEKISLKEVEENWDKLNLFPDAKRLMEFLIWGKISPKSKKSFWIK